MRKPNISQREQERRARQSEAATEQGLPQLERRWVTGPTLRKILNISSVTLWRWRHDPSMGFPIAKRINGRTFFAWHEVAAWLEKQPNAA
jgi:hypothetical protein